ncbi:MAG TPA: hypothetical protein VLD86_16885 [Ilumatobacteraceae bacterium]|nr:hypothetical protein [Ilumatobacteraceae bacterium]
MSGLRTELTLHKVNKRLIRRNVPLNERRRIRRDLRENLREASDAVGEKCAVQQLGDAETLAAEYAPASRRGPRVRAGAIAAAWTIVALVTVSLIRIPTFGTIDTFDRHTGATTWHVQLWRFAELSGDATTDTLAEGTVYSFGYLLAAALAFTIGARLWRIRSSRRRRAGRSDPR